MNYERRIDASALAQERAVPTETLKQGILTFQTSDGNIQTLNAADIKAVDPLHIGLNQGYLNVLKQYPVGNDPSYGVDGGLNFTGFRFNAPDRVDTRAYVAKMDFILDSSGTAYAVDSRHTVERIAGSTQCAGAVPRPGRRQAFE